MLARAALLALAAAAPLLAFGAPPAEAQVQTIQACDTSVRFVNSSSRTVTQLFYNPSSTSSWGNDRLGSHVMRSGQGYNARLQHPVPYDFRVVWDNGQSSELRRVNICVVSQIVATNQGLRAQ